jgi:hypothetical protein
MTKRKKMALVERLIDGALRYQYERMRDPLRSPYATAKFKRLCQRVLREAKGEK